MASPRGNRAFAAVFVAVTVGAALIVAAFILHAQRPRGELDEPSAAFVRATGKCASCHRRETPSVVHQFEHSQHANAEVNCLDCHRVLDGQEALDHRGFVITTEMTAANCAACHASEYQQFLRSRHAAPAWAAVRGAEDFTAEQIAQAEEHHPGTVERPPNALAQLEGAAAMASGCQGCHDIGKPNADGSIGTCTECHSRHTSSIEIARTPATCGQCHLGPDHSQIEIYRESKHGVIFASMRDAMDLDAPPDSLTTEDMWAPTCATCHMSGLEGNGVTHDTTERLGWFLFAPVSEARPNFARARTEMQGICLECHTTPRVERFYEQADAVVASANELVQASNEVMASLREEGLLTEAPFDEPVEFVHFDLWHYYGRTAKHGAFMGGPDYVQWHGFYELTAKLTELRHMAEEIRRAHGGSAVADEPSGSAGDEDAAGEAPASGDGSHGKP